jgi:ABC-type nitrate/sulfonate/bicarbonate transport system substrate-binding protein
MKVMPIGRSAQRLGGGRVRIAAGCAVAALLLAGCSGAGGSSASGSAPAGSSITVAAVPGVGDAPLYVAWRQGLFQQRGLTVHLRSYHTMAEVMTALHSGQANVAVGDYADFFYEQEHDSSAPMVVVADGYDAAPDIMNVLVSPDSLITTPQGLQGKTIGTAAPQLMPNSPNSPGTPYSMETVAASSALDNDGVQPNLVKWRPMPQNDLVNALRNHLVDAILVTEPEIFQAESQIGARTILDACSGETVNLPLDGYFAPKSFAENHQAALLAFRSVMTRAQAAAVQPAPVQSVLRHYAGMSRETASLITMGQYPTALKVVSLQRVADLMSFYGALPQPLVVSHMLLR